jgi:flagellar hook-associated protein 1 FlgK
VAFFEFNIAVSGLFAAQRGLSVSSNNITNATTPGYSRQVLGQTASTPLVGMGVGMLGSGVQTTNITRIRDSYIDTKLWSQNDKLGEYKIKVEQGSIIESVYGEPSDTGFTKVFNDLFNSIDSLSKLPDEKERQAGVRQQIISYGKYFNNISASLSGFQRDLNFELKAKVDEINLLGSKIQSLNRQIYQAEIYGDDANDFKDSRDLCVDRLSQLINVETKEKEVTIDNKTFNQYTVKIAGQTLVDHLSFRELGIKVRGEKEQQINDLAQNIAKATAELAGYTLPPATPAETAAIDVLEQTVTDNINALKKIDSSIAVTGNPNDYTAAGYLTYKITLGSSTLVENSIQTMLPKEKLNPEDIDGLYDVVWKDGLPFDMSDDRMSGELKGVIDMRDGRGTGSDVYYNGIPYYIKRMDDYVRQFSETMNEEYSKDKDGYVELIDVTSVTIPKTTLYKKADSNGVVKYYDSSKVLLATQPSETDIKSKYQAKYQLFAYSDGSSTGAPVTSPDLTNGYKNMTSANFSVSSEIFKDAGMIRTNYEHYPNLNHTLDINPNTSNNDLLLALSAQKNNKKMFKEGDPKDYMISMFSELGISTQEATMYEKTQTSITNNITNQRLAVSQVDPNEEFTNLIKYQQAYQAAAKIINTIDGIYETTIFKLGNF